MLQNEIQSHDPVLDGGGLMLTAIAVVLIAQGQVERLGGEMVDHAVVAIYRDLAVPVHPQLFNESNVFPALGASYKGEKLAAEKVAALERSYAQEPSFVAVISEVLKSTDALESDHKSLRRRRFQS
jgi:hypothetical protein